MPRARAKKVDGSVTSPGSSLPRKAVDVSVDVPEESERAKLVDDSAQNSVAGTKASDGGIPDVKMPDVTVAKVTINAPDEPQTASCCYCCCFETGLYWDIPKCLTANLDFLCLCMNVQNACGYTDERLVTKCKCMECDKFSLAGLSELKVGECDVIGNVCFCCTLQCGCESDLKKTSCLQGYCQACCCISVVSLPWDTAPPAEDENRPFVPFGIGLCGQMATGGRAEEDAGYQSERGALKASAANDMSR